MKRDPEGKRILQGSVGAGGAVFQCTGRGIRLGPEETTLFDCDRRDHENDDGEKDKCVWLVAIK